MLLGDLEHPTALVHLWDPQTVTLSLFAAIPSACLVLPVALFFLFSFSHAHRIRNHFHSAKSSSNHVAATLLQDFFVHTICSPVQFWGGFQFYTFDGM